MIVSIDALWGFNKSFEKKKGWELNVAIFMIASIIFSLIAFFFALVFFSGSEIYAFSLVFYVMPISFAVLMAASFALRRLPDKYLLLSYAARFGAMYLVPYIFIFLDVGKKLLNIRTHM